MSKNMTRRQKRKTPKLAMTMAYSLELVVVAKILEYWCCLELVAVRDTGKRNLRHPNCRCETVQLQCSVGFYRRPRLGGQWVSTAGSSLRLVPSMLGKEGQV